jgi:hypothetical protein
MEPDLKHAGWVQRPDEFQWNGSGEKSRPDQGGHSLHVALEAGELDDDRLYARLADAAPVERVWCEDQFAEPSAPRLSRSWELVTRPGLARGVVVLDASVGMRAHRGTVADALETLAAKHNLRILLAADEWREIEARDIRGLSFAGGHDNVPALVEALQQARGEGEAAVIWIHGSQPLRSGASERLGQLLERSGREVALYSVAVEPGGNRILEDLFKYQLVTAYSGAVVLETAEQYRRHGLTPVDPAAAPAVPSVPEPGVVMLLLPAAMIALLRRRREIA